MEGLRFVSFSKSFSFLSLLLKRLYRLPTQQTKFLYQCACEYHFSFSQPVALTKQFNLFPRSGKEIAVKNGKLKFFLLGWAFSLKKFIFSLQFC